MWRACAISLLLLAHQTLAAQVVGTDEQGQHLRQRHAELAPALAHSEFGRPLLIESSHGRDRDQGLVHAVLDAPMAQLRALAQAPRWCEVLMLHQTTQRCQPSADGRAIELGIASRGGEGVAIRLNFEVEQDSPQWLSVRLSADHGPLGSRAYEISLQATPLPSGESFMRFRYSYQFGVLARLAMQGYLNTWGQRKIGFSLEPGPGGAPVPVMGMRGVIERNTLRYFLGIEVVLKTLDLTPTQLHKRLEMWFDATERYPRQLHELERSDYLALKHRQLNLP